VTSEAKPSSKMLDFKYIPGKVKMSDLAKVKDR
jgi:hypothetical protein